MWYDCFEILYLLQNNISSTPANENDEDDFSEFGGFEAKYFHFFL